MNYIKVRISITEGYAVIFDHITEIALPQGDNVLSELDRLVDNELDRAQYCYRQHLDRCKRFQS
jgi:hypothetical protein